jgi:hypothetical protein
MLAPPNADGVEMVIEPSRDSLPPTIQCRELIAYARHRGNRLPRSFRWRVAVARATPDRPDLTRITAVVTADDRTLTVWATAEDRDPLLAAREAFDRVDRRVLGRFAHVA